jgi:hypothetical protein
VAYRTGLNPLNIGTDFHLTNSKYLERRKNLGLKAADDARQGGDYTPMASNPAFPAQFRSKFRDGTGRKRIGPELALGAVPVLA